MTTERMDAHEIARLAIEAAPHIPLLERIGGHLDMILRAATALRTDWGEIETAMAAAQNAPEVLRAAFYKTVWDTYGKRYSLPPELMGALAHERRKSGDVQPTPPAPITAADIDAAFPEDPAPVKVDGRRKTPEAIAAHVADLNACAALLSTLPLSRAEVVSRLEELGTKVQATRLSSIATGRAARLIEQGEVVGLLSPKATAEVYAGLQLIAEQLKSPKPVDDVVTSAPTIKARQPVEVAHKPRQAPLPSTRKEREAVVARLAVAGQHFVMLNDVQRACGISSGAAIQLLRDCGLRHVGSSRWRLD